MVRTSLLVMIAIHQSQMLQNRWVVNLLPMKITKVVLVTPHHQLIVPVSGLITLIQDNFLEAYQKFLDLNNEKFKYMKKSRKLIYLILILVIILCLIQFSCFIRLPVYSRDNSKKYIGVTYELQRDILIEGGTIPFSYEIKDKWMFENRNLYFETIPKGSSIKISSIVKRRLPMGVCYYYVCRNLNNQKEFDMNFEMADSLGLPNLLDP